MQILYIIGNGFDLNLELKTSYQHFYEYYKGIPSENTIVKKLKQDILSKSYETWADLELGLGKYTEELDSANELEEILTDIINELSKHLQSQEKAFDITKFDRDKFIQDIQNPFNYFEKGYKEIFENYVHNSDWYINAISFNYTTVFDKLIGINKQDFFDIGKNITNRVNYFGKIEHIHGYTDDRMVLGVNGIEQISKKSFHSDDDAKTVLIKNEYNTAMQHRVEKVCENYINEAHLICIFGSSIGDTDNIWWKKILDRVLTDYCKLIIFHHEGKHFAKNLINRKFKTEKQIKNKIISKFDFSDDEKTILNNNIFVAVDTEMFNINKNPTIQHIAPLSIT